MVESRQAMWGGSRGEREGRAKQAAVWRTQQTR